MLLCALILGLLTVQSAWARPPVFATPDQAHLARAAESLQDGFEKNAFENLLKAAEWGNKEAQKNLAVMYIKGLGVPKNWARAYAWLQLAASQGEPRIVAARDEVFGALREDEKVEAEAHYRELLPDYGDRRAQERRERWVTRKKRDITGSRLGQIGALRIRIPDATGYTWDLSGEQYFGVLDSYVTELQIPAGEVEFGELEVLEDDEPPPAGLQKPEPQDDGGN